MQRRTRLFGMLEQAECGGFEVLAAGEPGGVHANLGRTGPPEAEGRGYAAALGHLEQGQLGRLNTALAPEPDLERPAAFARAEVEQHRLDQVRIRCVDQLDEALADQRFRLPADQLSAGAGPEDNAAVLPDVQHHVGAGEDEGEQLDDAWRARRRAERRGATRHDPAHRSRHILITPTANMQRKPDPAAASQTA